MLLRCAEIFALAAATLGGPAEHSKETTCDRGDQSCFRPARSDALLQQTSMSTLRHASRERLDSSEAPDTCAQQTSKSKCTAAGCEWNKRVEPKCFAAAAPTPAPAGYGACAQETKKKDCKAAGCEWDSKSEPKCFEGAAPTPAPPTPVPDTSEQYVPGTPGGAWTESEALIVKAKLFKLFGAGDDYATELVRTLKQRHGHDYECVTGPQWNETCGVWPGAACTKDICETKTHTKADNLAATMVRLGFHDCVKYKDGTGGCDGCLEFGPMFRTMSQTKSIAKRMWPDSSVGNGNNGLEIAADLLEEVYTDAGYPSEAPALEKSLKLSGKSRADLWAFAAMAGAEYGEIDNNRHCVNDGDRTKDYCDHLYNHVPGLESICLLDQTSPPKFFTGRVDCTSQPADPATSSAVPHRARGWETEKAESQADAYFNGTAIASYFERDFGFSRQETVAIMGAHSFGGFGFMNSGFKYTWQWQMSYTMNNNYYRLLLGKDTKFIKCKSGQEFRATGGPNGALARSGWWLRPLYQFTSGGSFLWFHYYERCPDCAKDKNGKWTSYEERGESYFQRDECCKCNEQTPDDPDWDPDCFINVTRDETAIHADMALAYRFSVSANGVIEDSSSCPGLNLDDWNSVRLADTSLDDLTDKSGGIHDWDMAPLCKPNEEKDGEGSMTMRELVEHYAEDQNAWIRDFDAAFEKMLRNGYTDQDLKRGPDVIGLGKTNCERQKGSYQCVLTPDTPTTGVPLSLLSEAGAMLNSDVQMQA